MHENHASWISGNQSTFKNRVWPSTQKDCPPPLYGHGYKTLYIQRVKLATSAVNQRYLHTASPVS